MAGNRSSRQLFYEAATAWVAYRGSDNATLIDAAVTALLAGLDSPTLREIAATRPDDDTDDLRLLLDSTVSELALPRLGSLAATDVVADDGSVSPRVAANTLRFDVVPSETWDGFEVKVFVDGVEMTSRGAGAGMGPATLFVPRNRLLATPEPHVAPIARCECGEYGCGVTDVRIVRQGEVVHWDWLVEVPMRHGVTFDAEHYDVEVDRVASDRSWERIEDFVHREVLVRADAQSLETAGLTLSSAWPDHRDRDRVRVSMQTTDGEYQVFVHVGLDEAHPERTVAEALRILARSPDEWAAEFHAVRPAVTTRPGMAGASWTRFDFPGFAS